GTIGTGGNGGIVKTGAGTLVLAGSGANTYNQHTEVLQGTLNLAKTVAVAAVPATATSLVVNPGLSVNVTSGVDGQIGNTASIRLLEGATLNLNGRSTAASVADITMVGATINTGGGVLNMSGNIFVNDSPNSSTINGVVNFTNAARNFVVADG